MLTQSSSNRRVSILVSCAIAIFVIALVLIVQAMNSGDDKTIVENPVSDESERAIDNRTTQAVDDVTDPQPMDEESSDVETEYETETVAETEAVTVFDDDSSQPEKQNPAPLANSNANDSSPASANTDVSSQSATTSQPPAFVDLVEAKDVKEIWEKDYETALAKATAESRPIFLMLTATWCGPCKALERQTLSKLAVQNALQEFVWVKAYEDKTLNEKFNLRGYPTLVFIDPNDETILSKTSGFRPIGPFLRHSLKVRKAANLPLTDEMIELANSSFEIDHSELRRLEADGDVEGLVDYLSPLEDDQLREKDAVVCRLTIPASISSQDIICSVGRGDRIVGDSGVFTCLVNQGTKSLRASIIVPGFGTINETIEVRSAVQSHEFNLKPLSDEDAIEFSGQVLGPDNKPVSDAIVRVADWDVTRTDSGGRFRFERLAPGTFLVRAEAPGGEFHRKMEFEAGKDVDDALQLQPATTVGIRWAVQTREGIQDLVGEGVRTGEAYFSASYSRFLLERGTITREYWGSDFMLRDSRREKLKQYMDEDIISLLDESSPGTPFFWLFDGTSRSTGLHLEEKSFDEIQSVNDGKPFNERSYFKFLRGRPVIEGDVFTLRGVRRDTFAKLEITDVTIVEKPQK